MEIAELSIRDAALLESLLSVWERSVRATHLFLSEPEIESIKACVPQALAEVPRLIVAKDGQGQPVAFMGVAGQILEMLFIAPERRRQGLGKALLLHGIRHYGVCRLTVNEQNPQARGFYEHMGFAVYRRSERDEEGRPYPLLYMRRMESAPASML